MMELSVGERRRLRRLLRAIQAFRRLDPDMQMPMAATLLTVALKEGVSRTEVMERLAVAGSTASRNLTALTARGRLGRAGNALVRQYVNPQERRWRLHALTPQGKRFVRFLLNMLDDAACAEDQDSHSATRGPAAKAKKPDRA